MKKTTGNWHKRRATVVMADGHLNIELVHIEVKLRTRIIDGETRFEVEQGEAETEARKVMANAGANPKKWEFVGVMAAQLEGAERGRVNWAIELKANPPFTEVEKDQLTERA